MVYVGISRYTDENVKKLLELGSDGVVLGDLLCDRRMFPYGGTELTDLMRRFKNKGLSVIYQTPMYATDRSFSKIQQQVVYFNEKKLVDAVIVQDIGLASAISGRCKNLTVIWGRMGYARTPIVNRSTLVFYMKHGVNAFECKNEEQAEFAAGIGAAAYLVYGYPKYLTINRECYYRFENNVFEADCGLGCLRHEKMLLQANQGIETSIDGYVLGWQYVYDEKIKKATTYNRIVYADSLSDAAQRLNEVASCDK